MIKYTEHCDLCTKEFNNDKNGFCVELGYSLGGWGRRSDFTHKRTMEICNTCFSEVKEQAMLFDKTLKKLQR